MNTSEKHLVERLKTATEQEQIQMSEYLLRAGRTSLILEAGGAELLRKVRAAMKNHEYMVANDNSYVTVDSGRRISFK